MSRRKASAPSPKDMLGRWWLGPILFALVGSPVAAVGLMLTNILKPGEAGEGIGLLGLLAIPIFLPLFIFMALAVGIPVVLLGGAVAGILARGRLGDAAYILLLAAWSAALALAGYRLNAFDAANSSDAYIAPAAWQFAVAWAVGAAVVCWLLRRSRRGPPGAGT